ncbi:MAG: hypothetical protein Q7S74_01565 [Nanoarchaeota archaeon]|nr:hypothetical protein [Nanoarchaeota archaeon]
MRFRVLYFIGSCLLFLGLFWLFLIRSNFFNENTLDKELYVVNNTTVMNEINRLILPLTYKNITVSDFDNLKHL